jgi:ABC-type Na+ efflux pump permease subunit
MAVIYVLWLREVKKYLRSRPQIIASLGQPLMYLLALGFGPGPVFQQAGRGSYLQFVAPGVIGMPILFMSNFSGVGLLWDRQFGFLKEALVAPVSRLQIMTGRTLGGATVATLQGVLVLAGLPRALTALTRVDRLSYGVDALRATPIGVSHFGLATDLTVLAALAAAFLALGARAFSRIQV